MPPDEWPVTRFSPGRHTTAITVVSLSALVLLIYGRDLGGSPMYLHYDEVFFGIQAHSIASTGRDTHGRFMPAYFELYPASWGEPALIYFTALFLKVLPVSEGALRLPTVFVGLFDVVLMYLIAKRIFRRWSLAVFAAVLLTLTPAHFIMGRLAMDYLYPVPFLLAWLLCLIVFLERREPWILFAATSLLGVGCYTYIGAVGMTPLYLLMTCLALWLKVEKPWKLFGVALAGFAWPLLLSIPFHLAYPELRVDQFRRYGPSQGGGQLDPVQQARELFNYVNLTARVTLYFNFFNPGYLFLSGGANPVDSTRQAGVFLLPVAVFLPIGIYQVLQHRRTVVNLILLLGFITAPLAALVVFESGAIDRELELLPFGVLLATFGVEYLWSAPLTIPLRKVYVPLAATGIATGVAYAAWAVVRQGRISSSTLPLIAASTVIYLVGVASDQTKRWRIVTACLLLFGVVQFRDFDRDYFTDYRLRTIGNFGGNLRGALEEVIAREDAANPRRVYISKSVQYADSYWRFYLIKLGRLDLLNEFRYFDSTDVDLRDLPEGSFVLLAAGVTADDAIAGRPELTAVTRTVEPDGTAAFLTLQKNR